jgi:hypothetical protein
MAGVYDAIRVFVLERRPSRSPVAGFAPLLRNDGTAQVA